jgi:hypothetical protein
MPRLSRASNVAIGSQVAACVVTAPPADAQPAAAPAAASTAKSRDWKRLSPSPTQPSR